MDKENNGQGQEQKKASIWGVIWQKVKTPLKYTAAVCVGIGAGVGGHKILTKTPQTPCPDTPAPAPEG